MSFDIGHLKFIDSFQFMSSSLEDLVDDLKDDSCSNFPSLKSEFGEDTKLLCRKAFYPYEWFDNINKFEFNGLPRKSELYAQNVNKTMNCNNSID
jgi:hypothetical protein